MAGIIKEEAKKSLAKKQALAGSMLSSITKYYGKDVVNKANKQAISNKIADFVNFIDSISK